MGLKEQLEEAISKNNKLMADAYDICKAAVESKDYGVIYDYFMKIAPDKAQGTREEFIEQIKSMVEMGQVDFMLSVIQMLMKDMSKVKFLKANETDSAAGYYYWNVDQEFVTVGVAKLKKEGASFANNVNYYETSFQSSGDGADDQKKAMQTIDTDEGFKL